MIARTSIESFYDTKREGQIGRMQRRVLELVERYPLRTDRELARLGGFADPNSLRPRRTELYEAGYLVPGGQRRCEVTGRTAMTWRRRVRREQGELFDDVQVN